MKNLGQIRRLSGNELIEFVLLESNPKGVDEMAETAIRPEETEVEPAFVLYTLTPEGEVERTGDVEKNKAAAKRKLKIMQEIIESFGYSGIRFAVNNTTGEIVSGFYLPDENEDEE